MRKFVKLLFAMFILAFAVTGYAQTGKIKGKVVDKETGEGLPGANVVVEGTMRGAATDLNGNYLITGVPVGKYTVIATMMGYGKQRFENLEIIDGGIAEANFILSFEIIAGQEVVVEADPVTNTEAALLKNRQKAIAVSDAISSEAISNAGSGNAAEAMTYITGASVMDGKYIYVRGLGDRYTSTQLNGAEIPSTDPYKRAGSIDLIPANLIDNIVTVKSFTPDKPGNFSGGTVDIKTRDFPDKIEIKFSSSASYNSQTTFNSDGPIGYKGGKYDWLGFDDGSRDIPKSVGENGLPSPKFDAATLDKLISETRAFGQQMAPQKITPPLNQSYSISLGNQFDLFKRPLGFMASFSYNRNYSSYQNGQYNAWSLGSSRADKLTNIFAMNDTKTSDEVLWGGLMKVSYKLTPMNIISLNTIYNVNGESNTRYLEGKYDYDKLDAIDDLSQNRILGYNERHLTSFQLDGEHQFPVLFGTKFTWSASVSRTRQDEPDLRYFTSFMEVEGNTKTPGLFSNLPPSRFFRKLNENSKEFSANLKLPFTQWSGLSGYFKIGGLVSAKDRDFTEKSYIYNFYNNYDGNPDNYFSEKNIRWDSTFTVINGVAYPGYRIGLYLKDGNMGANDYTADQKLSAYYAMVDLPLLSKLRFIGGARYEITNMNLNSLSPSKKNGEILTWDLLPSLNLIYSISENMNLRGSATRTLARPNFREMAPYASFDFSAGFTSIGNPRLMRTLIDNYDLRWEWFSRPGEIYAVSAFYKNFTNPIERAFIVEATNREITWVNVQDARNYGIEFEVRKKLDVLHEKFRNFLIGSNLSLVNSKIVIPEDELRLMRLNNPDMASSRPLEGQSPYLLNLNVTYDNLARGMAFSLYYNIFGRRLAEVNKSGEPYVFEQPAGTLNASFSWRFMPHLNLKLAGKNLLNAQHKKTQNFNGTEYIFTQFTRGRTFSIGLGYSL